MSATVTTNFTPQQLADSIITNALLVGIGTHTIAIVRERTGRGEFLEGSSPGANKYSQRAAHMPLGALAQRIGKGKGPATRAWKALKGENLYRQSSTGKIWIILQGGYKQLRELAGRETSPVTLNWAGTMMREMKFQVNLEERSVTVYFTSGPSAQKAAWLTQGAGRNKIKRIFMALSPEELALVVKDAEAKVHPA